MNQWTGNILKMVSHLESPVRYQLPIGDDLVDLNPMIGQKVTIEFDGVINCIATGEKIKKTYNQGYSYKAFTQLAACDLCIVKPELCHYAQGTCRQPEWGDKNCMIPHIIYLSNTGQVKVGITRETQVPTRWIDQGASEALAILRVPDRYTSGLIEVELKKSVADRTNWRQMLKGDFDKVDLIEIREELFDLYGDILDDLGAEDLDEEIVEIQYPVEALPEKFTSIGLDKTHFIESTLIGIRGQYLIFEDGVMNIRKHQGYLIKLTC